MEKYYNTNTVNCYLQERLAKNWLATTLGGCSFPMIS